MCKISLHFCDLFFTTWSIPSCYWAINFVNVWSNGKLYYDTTTEKLAFECSKRPQACNFIKRESLAEVFSCEFCEISMNTFFTEHLWTTATALWHKVLHIKCTSYTSKKNESSCFQMLLRKVIKRICNLLKVIN